MKGKSDANDASDIAQNFRQKFRRTNPVLLSIKLTINLIAFKTFVHADGGPSS